MQRPDSLLAWRDLGFEIEYVLDVGAEMVPAEVGMQQAEARCCSSENGN